MNYTKKRCRQLPMHSRSFGFLHDSVADHINVKISWVIQFKWPPSYTGTTKKVCLCTGLLEGGCLGNPYEIIKKKYVYIYIYIYDIYIYLDGGFTYFLFSPLFGEDFQFDYYFSKGLTPPTRYPYTLVELIVWENNSNHVERKETEKRDSK